MSHLGVEFVPIVVVRFVGGVLSSDMGVVVFRAFSLYEYL